MKLHVELSSLVVVLVFPRVTNPETNDYCGSTYLYSQYDASPPYLYNRFEYRVIRYISLNNLLETYFFLLVTAKSLLMVVILAQANSQCDCIGFS